MRSTGNFFARQIPRARHEVHPSQKLQRLDDTPCTPIPPLITRVRFSHGSGRCGAQSIRLASPHEKGSKKLHFLRSLKQSGPVMRVVISLKLRLNDHIPPNSLNNRELNIIDNESSLFTRANDRGRIQISTFF